MTRLPAPFATVLTILLATPILAADAPKSKAEAVEFFESKVRPVLAEHCFGCHGPEKQKGGLRLDTLEALKIGGDSGPALVAGKPEESLLIEAVRYEGEPRMPPDGRLKDGQIDALTKWVQQGAHWENAGTKPIAPATGKAGKIVTDKDREFWAFRPIGNPPLPAVAESDWVSTEIDRFILAGLEAKGLMHAPAADRRTLIRRLTFDLTGLPPAPEEVETYVADSSPEAYERVVDRLLASPRFGERWARHWLDIARYGEDQAHSFQPRLYPNGWRYRDWLVASFNADRPFDDFLRQQIAADLIDGPDRNERLPALGLFACGPVYYGDAKKFDQMDDRVDTLTRGVLGLTVSCARCHDHKYDSITQDDYYALAGVFASSEYEEAPLAPKDVVETYKKLKAQVDARDKGIETFLSGKGDEILTDRLKDASKYLTLLGRLDNKTWGESGELAKQAKGAGLDPVQAERWAKQLKLIGDKKVPTYSDWSSARRDVFAGKAEATKSLESAARAVQTRLIEAVKERGSNSKDADRKALLAEFTVEKGLLNLPKNRVEANLNTAAKAELKALRSEADSLKKQLPDLPIAHALKDGSPRDLKILARGNPDAEGVATKRHFLTVLGGHSLARGSGRLELADEVTRRDNPLTSRVYVNRVWTQLFGKGLVNTPSNFGVLGERPSHPELLDHLSRRFIDSGWSVKGLIRRIVLSSAYRQSSRPDENALQLDPENRLVWRMNSRRLEVEAWRDALLQVSGRLETTMGGPSFKLENPDVNRRTLYAMVSRHDLNPLLRLFDFPDPNITSAQRTQTTVPLQQLIVLNDEVVIKSAKALAARVQAERLKTLPERVDRAYKVAYGRPATATEQAIAARFLGGPDSRGTPDDLTRWERYAHALLASNEFLYIH